MRPPDAASINHFQKLLIGRSASAGTALESTSLESTGLARSFEVATGAVTEGTSIAAEPSGLPHPDDVLGRIDVASDKFPVDEVPDPGELRRALDIVARHGGGALRKLRNDPRAPLTSNEAFGLEAVVKADGTRPSFLLRDGRVSLDHPLLGDWRTNVSDTAGIIQAAARSVGRIQPTAGGASRFFGTGTLVDREKGLVLTNLHVLEALMNYVGTLAVQQSDGSYRILDGVVIDFVGETSSIERNVYKVVSGRPSGIDGPGFERLDLAVLTIEPTSDSKDLGQAVTIRADLDAAGGAVAGGSVALIGFPGPPPLTSGTVQDIDWGWVNATLFGAKYGLKRLAPGEVFRPLGTEPGDERKWVFGHDITTLGGSSGTLVLAWLAGGYGFGLHFAGWDVSRPGVHSNYAHALARCVEVLQKLRINVAAPNS